MKILLISASPKREKSQSFALAKEVLRGAANRKTRTDVIHLCDLKIDFCRACESCHVKILDCPIRDDAGIVLRKMLCADGIIFATPNYINQVTASLKALFDRSTHFIHCLRMEGKYVAGAVTAGGGQGNMVLDYLKHYANTCGARYSGGVFSRPAIDREKNAEAGKLGAKLARNVQKKPRFADQEKIIAGQKRRFQKIMEFNKDRWVQEYKYWVDQGWL